MTGINPAARSPDRVGTPSQRAVSAKRYPGIGTGIRIERSRFCSELPTPSEVEQKVKTTVVRYQVKPEQSVAILFARKPDASVTSATRYRAGDQ